MNNENGEMEIGMGRASGDDVLRRQRNDPICINLCNLLRLLGKVLAEMRNDVFNRAERAATSPNLIKSSSSFARCSGGAQRALWSHLNSWRLNIPPKVNICMSEAPEKFPPRKRFEWSDS